jgi:hypothetical protein
MAFTGATLTTLNYFTKDFPTGRIVPFEKLEFPLLEALRPNIQTEDFVAGQYMKTLIKTARPFTGKAHYEDADVPLPGASGYVEQLVPLRELIANAGISQEALDRATGGEASWGKAVDESLNDLKDDFDHLLELAVFGQGLGALARVYSNTESPSGTYTIVCDNTYADSGVENVALLKKDMLIDVYTTNTLRTTAAGALVTSVTFGDRANGAATTGTVVFTDTTGATIANDDIIYLHGSKGYMPMGLTGIVQGSGAKARYAGIFNVTAFQGLTRASYGCLQSKTYEATDFGLASESPSDGTPTSWDLSVISDCITDVRKGTGKGLVDFLLCSETLAMAIQRRNKAESNITVNVGTTAATQQNVAGSRYAGSFICPDGRIIPVRIAATIPDNVLYGLTLGDLRWGVKGGFDFKRPTGEVWMKSPADRKLNFEAPFGGYMQISADRCDNAFVLMDLRTDI